eukprot:3590837-Rhodomonas_salina.2
MSSFFSPQSQVAPVFEKPQEQMREAAAAAASGAAAGESTLPPETVTILEAMTMRQAWGQQLSCRQ